MTYASINPATGKTFRTWQDHDDAYIEDAVQKAAALYLSEWAGRPVSSRVEVLKNLALVLEENSEELAVMASREMGKLLGQSRSEVKICADIARYYALNAERFLASVAYESPLGDAWIEHHPIGVILAVEPWNFPFYQLMRVLAPNIAAGNPVLVKHSSVVPGCAALFEKMVNDAGAPAGAWTNLFISGERVATLIADPRLKGVALTGSEGAGSAVAQVAGKYLKKSTLELGGNDVFVVLDDCDLDRAVKTAVASRLINCGQACTAAKRFLVQESIAERFVHKMQQAFEAVRIGDPLDESTTLGPLSSLSALDTLKNQVDRAMAQGARLVYGGKVIDREGYFYQPTILCDITRENAAYFEEFFGPVAQIYIIKTDDDAVSLANDSDFGLGGAIFTGDTARGCAMASRIETGMVYINSATDTSPELPFGGIKRSGYGRELSDLGIKEFINQKLVVISKGKGTSLIG